MKAPNPCPYHEVHGQQRLRLAPALINHWRVECLCGANGPFRSTKAKAIESWDVVAKPTPPKPTTETLH